MRYIFDLPLEYQILSESIEFKIPGFQEHFHQLLGGGLKKTEFYWPTRITSRFISCMRCLQARGEESH